MSMYLPASVCCFWSLWLKYALYFSTTGLVNGVINKHCLTFEEHLLSDAGQTMSCYHRPGLGPYADCNIDDFGRDLSEVGTEVRSLCIYSHSTFIPSNAFSHLKELELLIIFGYWLKSIEPHAFSGLLNLKYLTLNFNDKDCSSVALDSTLLVGLDHLEELSLIGIRLADIPYTLFDRLVALVDLILTNVCVQELGEVFCRLSSEMSHLKNLTVIDYNLTSVRKESCSGSRSWPLTVLSGIQNFDLVTESPLKILEAGSLAVFQNLSSLSLGCRGFWLGSVWESGVGKVNRFTLSGDILQLYPTDFKDLCDLRSQLNFQYLVLTYVSMDTLSAKDLIDCGAKLKVLCLHNLKIQRVDPGFWTSLLGLQVMLMTFMQLTEAQFCAAGNETVWNITTLSLAHNHLKAIHTDQFICMALLEQLLLNDNNINILEPGAFRGLRHLRVLNLDSNHIKILAANDFESLGALKTLLISNNLIETIENGALKDQTELQELALGKLEYVYRLYLNLIFYGFPKKIKRLSIDAGPGTYIYLGNAGQPTGTFIFELTGTLLYIDNYYPPFFKAVRELKLSGSTFFMSKNFFVPYFVNLESLELKGHPERNDDYTEINALHYLKRLKLVDLNFSNKTDLVIAFQNLKHLRILLLINCRLFFLTKMMFRDLQSLELFRLYSVSPLILVDGMFDTLPALAVFVLDKVDFRCDCENGWLLEWAENTGVQVIYMQKQQCIWHYQKRNFLSTMEKLCQTDVQYLCYIGTAIGIFLLLLAAVGYRFARWPCVVLFFRVRGYAERKLGRRWRKRRQGRHGEDQVEKEEDEKYDAFVSFSSHDEDWVLEEMAPRLEEQGQPRLRLCLHHRDFEVGKGIVDNIAESIYSSQRTVCVISRRYLRSDWCSLEMRMATYRLLEEQKHRLILIFLEHISPFELNAFHRLAKLVKSRTYLDWPQDEAERVHFWERLRRNIAGGEMDANDTSVIEKITVSIDANNDGELSFQEFWQFIGQLANQHGGFNK